MKPLLVFLTSVFASTAFSASTYVSAYTADDVFKRLGFYNVDGKVYFGKYDLNKAIPTIDKILAGKEIHPDYVSGWFSLIPDYFQRSPQLATDVTIQVIDGLTGMTPPFDFSKGDALVQLIPATWLDDTTKYPQWESNIEVIVDKLIEKGQSPHQCDFMINLVRANFMKLLVKFAVQKVSLDQPSCVGKNTPLGVALTGKYVDREGHNIRFAQQNREASLFLYGNSADIMADGGTGLRNYLSSNSTWPALTELNSISPLDLDLLGSLAPLTWRERHKPSTERLEELLKLGIDVNKHALLWKLVETENISEDDGIKFSQALISAGADVNAKQNGVSLVEHVLGLKMTKWVLFLCNRRAQDQICKI